MKMSNNSTITIYNCRSYYTAVAYLNGPQSCVLGTLAIISAVVDVAANAAVVFSLVATDQLYNISLRLILCLSISDTCVGLIIMPIFAILLLRPTGHFCSLELACQFSGALFFYFSEFMVALIAVDRFIRMKYLNRYTEIVKDHVVHAVLLAIMFICVATSGIYTYASLNNSFKIVNTIFLIVGICIMVVVAIMYTFTIVVIKIRRREAGDKNMMEDVDDVVTSIGTKIIITVAIMYTPYFALSLIREWVTDKSVIETQQWAAFVILISYIMVFDNSIASAVIFLSLNKRAQQKLKNVFRMNINEAQPV